MTSTDELLQVHSRYPVLAVFLSLCNPSTTSFRLSLSSRQAHAVPSPSGGNPKPLERALLTSRLAPTEQPIERLLLAKNMINGRFRTVSEWQVGFLHLVVGSAAAVAVWQSVELGVRGINIFGCRSWWNPLLWLLCGGSMHLWNVVWSRLCLASRPQARRTIPSLRWTWSLWSVRERLYLKRPDLARFNDLLMSGTALINYMFSTMLLSGMQLIHAEAALRIACVFCVMAVIARLMTIWILEVLPLEGPRSEVFPLEDEEKVLQ